MNMGNFIGPVVGIALVNGKLKPKYGIKGIIGIVLAILFLLVFIGAFIYGLLNINIEFIIMPLIGIFGFGYVLLINPYLQKSSNYYIEFQNENSLVGFKLFYKGKLVNILYKVDGNGKIAFANNNNKLSCISYADNTKMNKVVKFRIINYFSKWLNDNKLLSSEITTTFE